MKHVLTSCNVVEYIKHGYEKIYESIYLKKKPLSLEYKANESMKQNKCGIHVLSSDKRNI